MPTPITITGSGFAAPATVTVGSAAATEVVVVNATTITCKAPGGTPGAIVSLTVAVAGRTATGVTFRYNDPLADLEGTWRGEQSSLFFANGSLPHGFTANASGNASMTFVSGQSSTFSVLDEVNRVYRVVRTDGVTSIMVLSADKKHIADLDQFRVVGCLERGAVGPAQEGYWHPDLRASAWQGVAVLPTASMQVATLQSANATVDDTRRFAFAGAATATAPLALFPTDGFGTDRGLFTGDFVGAGGGPGDAFLLESPDKTFAAIALSLGDITTTMLGAWERTSAAPPAHPVVALASTPLNLFQLFGVLPTFPHTILGGSKESFFSPPAVVGAILSLSAPPTLPLVQTTGRSSSPAIAAWFDRLVNGVDNTICYQVNCGSANGAQFAKAESAELQNKHPSLTGIDLQGARVVELSLQLDTYTVATISISLTGTLTYFGRVE